MIDLDQIWAPTRRLLDCGRVEAIRLNDPLLGTEHFLLAMVADRECTASRILRAIGIHLPDLVASVESLMDLLRPRGAFLGNMTFRAELVIELAVEDALRLDTSVGSELIHAAILREGGGIASHALASHGVTLTGVRAQTDLIGLLDAAFVNLVA